MGLGLFVVSKGVKGIETAAKFLIPSLIILVIVLAIRAVTLPGAAAGLAFLFTPHLADLADSRIWLEALTQNAWDTGAGWGLVLTYAIYMRSQEDTALNAFVIGFGNNSMSLLAGIMVLGDRLLRDARRRRSDRGRGQRGAGPSSGCLSSSPVFRVGASS